MQRPPTISDIAAEAQVSASTVSRVLSGTTPVAAEKRAAVLAAVERLNFRPNLHARSLASGRTISLAIHSIRSNSAPGLTVRAVVDLARH